MSTYHGLLSFHLKRLWKPCFSTPKKHKDTILVIAAIAGIILVIIVLIRLVIGDGINDILHSIISLFADLLGIVFVFWLGMVGISAYEIHKYLFDRFAEIWIKDHEQISNASSFKVPYWRFWLGASVPSFFVFFILVEPAFLLWLYIGFQSS